MPRPKKSSKQRIQVITEWKREHVDRILLEFRKETKAVERLAMAVSDGKASSRQEYIINAIEKQLALDGYSQEKIENNN